MESTSNPIKLEKPLIWAPLLAVLVALMVLSRVSQGVEITAIQVTGEDALGPIVSFFVWRVFHALKQFFNESLIIRRVFSGEGNFPPHDLFHEDIVHGLSCHLHHPRSNSRFVNHAQGRGDAR